MKSTYDQKKIDALASELMEPQQLAGGGAIRRAAEAIRGAAKPADEALDMSAEARRLRAAQQGFNVDEVLYHGTDKSFENFIPKRGLSGTASYLTPDADIASAYAMGDVTGKRRGEGANILPAYVRGNILSQQDLTRGQEIDIWKAIEDYELANAEPGTLKYEMLTDKKFPSMSESLLETTDEEYVPDFVQMMEKLAEIKRTEDILGGLGYTGVRGLEELINARNRPGLREYESIAVFDPKNIRSVNARFNPLDIDSSNILSGLGAAAIGAGALTGEDDPEGMSKGGLVDKLRSAASSVKEAGNVYKAAVGNMFSPFEPTEPQLGDPNDYEFPELRLRRPGIVNLALGMPNMPADMRYLFGAVKDAAIGDEVPDEEWRRFDMATEAQGRYEDDMDAFLRAYTGKGVDELSGPMSAVLGVSEALAQPGIIPAKLVAGLPRAARYLSNLAEFATPVTVASPAAMLTGATVNAGIRALPALTDGDDLEQMNARYSGRELSGEEQARLDDYLQELLGKNYEMAEPELLAGGGAIRKAAEAVDAANKSTSNRPVNEQLGIDRAKNFVEESGYRWNDVKQITTPEEYLQFQRRYGLASAVSERDDPTDVFHKGGAMFYDQETGAPVAYAPSGSQRKKAEGMADGGLVYDADAINALANELMEPVKLAEGGPPRSKIRKAAEAVQAGRSIGDDPLEGAPIRANVPNVGEVRLGRNREAEEAARRASEMTGVPYRPTTRYAPVDVDRATSIAREYDLMRHDPDDPLVKMAYEQMIKETNDQYEAMLQAGIEPYFIEPGNDPYRNSPYEALLDVAENRRLGVFPSVAGFGTDPNFNPAGNPMLQPTGRIISGQPALANDLFRAVHDYFGHAKPGVGFRAAGEENAYQSHAGMYSPLARRALASETRGQNSWLNYGPYGETNRTAKIEDTRFADQKAGLMPRWASEAGLVINDDRRREFFDNLARNQTGLEGAISDDGKLRLIHYSSKPLERIDPEFYGRGLSRASLAERNRSYDPEFVKRSYYGIPASEKPYVPEFGLGGIRNEVLIEPELIYQAQANPEGLWLPRDPTGSERRIAEAGYTGYYTTDPKLGKVAVIFDPYDVSKSYMIPVGAVGAGAMAMSGEEEPQELAGGGKIRRAASAIREATTPPREVPDELSVSDEEMMRIARDLGVDVDETIIPSDVPTQPIRRTGYGRSTIRGAGRKTIPGIYDDPRLIVERASAAVAPESEAMQQLFGVTREDLAKVAMEREPVVWSPPGAPARPRGTDYAALVMQPANTQRLVDILDEASESPLRAGMTGWYMLDPAYRRLVELVGEDEAKKLFVDMNTLTGVHSANAAVANELTRGTAMNWLNRENRLSDYVKYGAKAGMEGAPADMATIPGHLAHKTAHIIPALRYLETGELSKEAKTPAYITASNPPEIGTNVNFPVGDAHFVRAIGLSDVRPETKDPSARFASWSMPEAMQLNDWFTSDVARRAGLSGVSAQALLWGALSPTTGVKSKIGAPKLEILADLIMQTAQRLRISPEEARDMVLLGRAYAGKAAGGLVGYKQQISGEM